MTMATINSPQNCVYISTSFRPEGMFIKKTSSFLRVRSQKENPDCWVFGGGWLKKKKNFIIDCKVLITMLSHFQHMNFVNGSHN